MSVDHRGAWSDFWAQNSNGQTGCLPAARQRIEAAQRGAWTEFAGKLPRNAHVLDLATGNGQVMSWLLSARRDLKLTGIDLADSLPPAPAGTKVRAGVAMEKLPFANGRFAAVVSQFGFEYSDLPAAAAEVARVLAPGGIVGLMTHRHDGPILAHNLARREQVQWAIDRQDLPEIAKRSLAMRQVGIGTVPPAIAQAPAEGARKFGARSAGWEIAEAVRQCLVLGSRDAPANVARLIDSIAAKARNELGRIASLEAACAQTADAQGFVQALANADLVQVDVRALSDGSGQSPFADFRRIERG